MTRETGLSRGEIEGRRDLALLYQDPQQCSAHSSPPRPYQAAYYGTFPFETSTTAADIVQENPLAALHAPETPASKAITTSRQRSRNAR